MTKERAQPVNVTYRHPLALADASRRLRARLMDPKVGATRPAPAAPSPAPPPQPPPAAPLSMPESPSTPMVLRLHEVAKALRKHPTTMRHPKWIARLQGLGAVKVGRDWLVPIEAVTTILKGGIK